jgi:hypothetical protein
VNFDLHSQKSCDNSAAIYADAVPKPECAFRLMRARRVAAKICIIHIILSYH